MKTKQTITRKGSFDSMHRVMNEKMKCFNIHGHTYLYELEFEFNQIEEIGYAIDFKEIKRIGCQWIDDALDHGAILNKSDEVLYQAAKQLDSKIWTMSLNGGGYCNPTVENIAKEIFLAMEILFLSFRKTLRINKITLYETPNCYTICTAESISVSERSHFDSYNSDNLKRYAAEKGTIDYDDRNERSEEITERITPMEAVQKLIDEVRGKGISIEEVTERLSDFSCDKTFRIGRQFTIEKKLKIVGCEVVKRFGSKIMIRINNSWNENWYYQDLLNEMNDNKIEFLN